MFKFVPYFIMGYIHTNDLLREIEFSATNSADKTKHATENSCTKNRKIIHADVGQTQKEGQKRKKKENIY